MLLFIRQYDTKTVILSIHVPHSRDLDTTSHATPQDSRMILMGIALIVTIKDVIGQGIWRDQYLELVLDVEEDTVP